MGLADKGGGGNGRDRPQGEHDGYQGGWGVNRGSSNAN